MGMFDEVVLKYKVDAPFDISGLDCQTKDTPDQCLMNFEIREDGTIWRLEFETEDKSDYGRWKRENEGVPEEEEPKWSMSDFYGMCSRKNEHWEHATDVDGEVFIYTFPSSADFDKYERHTGWIEFKCVFGEGNLKDIKLHTYRPATINAKFQQG